MPPRPADNARKIVLAIVRRELPSSDTTLEVLRLLLLPGLAITPSDAWKERFTTIDITISSLYGLETVFGCF